MFDMKCHLTCGKSKLYLNVAKFQDCRQQLHTRERLRHKLLNETQKNPMSDLDGIDICTPPLSNITLSNG